MNVESWLKQSEQHLKASGIATARLDVLVLLEDELNKSRTHLLAHSEIDLTSDNLSVLSQQLKRRSRHEPLAFVRGKTEFYGREFTISPAVLEPRPESETMIELLLKLPLPTSLHIADVGTGSGALGITAKLELPKARVDLLEIDDVAMEVAKMNVIKFTTDITTTHSDLLAQAPHTYEILLCNLPYVPDGHTINQAAMHEPKIAIFGGPDGLNIYRRLFDQVKVSSVKPLFILTESLPPQHKTLAGIAKAAGYSMRVTDDFIQCFEVAV